MNGQLLCAAEAAVMAMTPCYAAFAGLKVKVTLVSLHVPRLHELAQDLQPAYLHSCTHSTTCCATYDLN